MARARPDLPGRRGFLRSAMAAAAAGLGGAVAARFGAVGDLVGAVDPCPPDPFAAGRLVGVVPFYGVGAPPPLGRMIGSGLDARLLTDLSTLTPETLVTPTDRFYVRTAAPRLPDGTPWIVSVDGLVARPSTVSLAEMTGAAEPRGPYVMECAGNADPRHFGLISAGRWSGIPLAGLIERVGPQPRAARVLISGVDDHPGSSRSSTPGASWIFPLDEIASTRAFLATGMNGEPLPRDHGWPVRLIVPGWYGCTCIKWVDRIALVGDDEPATEQMREFAARTFQDGVPDLARDYKPAAMDVAAMPVRIEKWIVDGAVVYRVVGILWGGATVIDRLGIRFNAGERFEPVAICPRPASTDSWTLWTHAWRPARQGRYRIALRPEDPSVPATRLDVFYYTREVLIEEI